MLHKFKTDTVAVAFKARANMTADYQHVVEHDVQALIHLYNALFILGKREELMKTLGTLVLSNMTEIVKNLPPEVAATLGASAPAAEKCKYCGGAHKSEAH